MALWRLSRCSAEKLLSKQLRSFARVSTVSTDFPKLALSLAEGDDQAWTDFERAALPRCSQWRGEDLVKVLHACTIAQRRPNQLLSRMAEEIPEKLPQLDVSSLCICLHSFAQLRSKQKALLKVISRHLLKQDMASELTSAHFSSLLYSHVRVLYFDAALARLASARMASEAWSVEDLATTLQAMATFRVEAPRLSTMSARQLAQGASTIALPVLGDLVEAMLRLSMPCRTLQQGLALRCAEAAELEGLNVEVLLKVLHCLAQVDANDAHMAIAEQLSKHIDELQHPRLLVQAIDALAQAQLREDSLLKPLGLQLVYHMVKFSSKDVAKTAVACQQLMLQDGAVYEALVRQALRRAQRLKLPEAEAVVTACRAAHFEHPALVELLEGMQQQKHGETQQKVVKDIEADWEAIEEEPIFFASSEALSEDLASSGPETPRPRATTASEAIHTHQWQRASREDDELEAAKRTSDLLEDRDIRRIMERVDRNVLRPAGLKSRSLAMIRKRR